MSKMSNQFCRRMIVAHEVTPEAITLLYEADEHTHFIWIGDEWHISFVAPVNQTLPREHVEHVAFFELCSGLHVAQVLGPDGKLALMVADS